MKRTLLLALLVSASFAACKSDGGGGEEPAIPGEINLKTSVNIDTEFVEARGTSTDFTTYTLKLNYPDGTLQTMPYPDGGTIGDLEPGSYTVALTSHPKGFTAPAFDEQVYNGSTKVNVKAGSTATASLVCTQANAGLYFNYDPSLAEAGFTNVIPTVVHSEGKLVYDGKHTDSRGYFNPGSVVVSATSNGQALTLGGSESQTFTLSAAQLWEINLSTETGGLMITVTVTTVDDPTNQQTWQISSPAEEIYPLANKDYIQLQKATVGNGVNIIFMGDGYTETDVNGTKKYEADMREGMEDFFSVYPYSRYRNHFNVWMVTGISAQSGISKPGSNRNTIFGCLMAGGGSTGISCDNITVEEYATSIPGLPGKEQLTAIVLINTDEYAGTCTMEDGWSISMCPRHKDTSPHYDKRAIVIHEAGGHGFAKLIDEYRYYGESMSENTKNSVKWYQAYGMFQNIDFTSNTANILWKEFLNYPKFTSQAVVYPVGAYEGCYMYEYGAWRPEDNSCMNNNIDYYNAPSRWEIVRRIKQYAGLSYSFEQFVADDRVPRPTYGIQQLRGPEEFKPLGNPIIIVR